MIRTSAQLSALRFYQLGYPFLRVARGKDTWEYRVSASASSDKLAITSRISLTSLHPPSISPLQHQARYSIPVRVPPGTRREYSQLRRIKKHPQHVVQHCSKGEANPFIRKTLNFRTKHAFRTQKQRRYHHGHLTALRRRLSTCDARA